LELEVAWYIRKNHSRLANRQARDKAKGKILKKNNNDNDSNNNNNNKKKIAKHDENHKHYHFGLDLPKAAGLLDHDFFAVSHLSGHLPPHPHISRLYKQPSSAAKSSPHGRQSPSTLCLFAFGHRDRSHEAHRFQLGGWSKDLTVHYNREPWLRKHDSVVSFQPTIDIAPCAPYLHKNRRYLQPYAQPNLQR
jgi:hypothetical protein